MSIQYLNSKSWTDISREERMFCSYLYHSLKGNLPNFINLVNEQTEKLGNSCEPLNNDENWEIGYEVCFFRDLLHSNNKGIKNYGLPQKRTFDLCLFSEKNIVIIEAKCHEGLQNSQMDEFMEDVENLEKLFGIIDKPCPHISHVLLVSSKYRIKETTKERFKEGDYRLLTWEKLCSLPVNQNEKKIFASADKLYRNINLEAPKAMELETINGVAFIPGVKTVDEPDLSAIFANIDAKELRKKVWTRKKSTI